MEAEIIDLRPFLFSDIDIECCKFPLKFSLVASHKFEHVVFSLSFTEKHFSIFIFIYFFDHRLFGAVLLSFKIFGNFPDIFL